LTIIVVIVNKRWHHRSLDGYFLTPIGKELFNLLKPLGAWSVHWAKQIAPDESHRWDAILKDKEK
jgi:DNA-binding HxlR family transcriptional regulator